MPGYEILSKKRVFRPSLRLGVDEASYYQFKLSVVAEILWLNVGSPVGYLASKGITDKESYKNFCGEVVKKTMERDIWVAIERLWKENDGECAAYVDRYGIRYKRSLATPKKEEWHHILILIRNPLGGERETKMRTRIVLTIILLGVGLCFVPALGYGEVKEWAYEAKESVMKVTLLAARVDYMMRNPTNFLDVRFYYDPKGIYEDRFPEGVHTKGKICITVSDNKDKLSYMSGAALLDQFKRELETAYSFISFVATNMDTDIVAIFCSRENVRLGYFYQGEYHLWEK